MSFDPAGDPDGRDGFPGSLFGIGHPYQNFVSEIAIPAPVISTEKSLADLPTARTLQPFQDVTGGRQTGGMTGTTLADVQVLPRKGQQNTTKLHWVMYEYYLPPSDLLTFGWSETQLAQADAQGAWRLGGFSSSATSRFLFEIPQRWADTYVGGRYLAAGRSRLVNGGSWGPALYASAPWNEGNPPEQGSSLAGTELLRYPDENHTVIDYSNADDLADAAWLTVGAKSAVVMVGTKGIRNRANGLQYYGEPQAHGCGAKGYHAEPYFAAMMFYDPADLAAVTTGALQPSDPQPYATLQVEQRMFRTGCRRETLAGVGFDRDNGLLYVMEQMVDDPNMGRQPIVHVWKLRDAGRLPDTTPPTTPIGLRVDSASATAVSLHWADSQDDVGPIVYLVRRDGLPIALTREATYDDGRVESGKTYQYTVEARDAVNNRSAESLPLAVSIR